MVTVVPAVAVATLGYGLSLAEITALAGLGSLFALVAAVTRALGQRVQRRLGRAWGMLPTESRLQAEAAGNPIVRDRRRQLLEQLTGEPLPSAAEETAEPEGARYRYGAAVKRLQIAARHRSVDAPLVHTELTSYNFARNLLGLKPVGLPLAIAATTADVARGLTGRWTVQVAVAAAIGVGLVGLWLFFIRPRWVRAAGESYADRLLDALETLIPADQDSPSPATSPAWPRRLWATLRTRACRGRDSSL